MNSLNILFFILLIILLYLSFTWRKHLHNIAQKLLTTRYNQLNSMFRAMPTKKQAIIFLGDSITEGANWQELFQNPAILNRGIGGDTSEGVLNRIDEVIRHQPSKLFIAIGTNDISRGISTETILSNYKLIISQVQENSPDSEIYIQSILPVNLNRTSVFGHNNKGILACNAALVNLSKEEKISYINLHPHFCDKEGNLKQEFTNDGLHLLGNAYKLWKDLILEYI